ncbi:MAG: tetratricopeptide repeat protein [Desulfamplus sp.]|nr:tetratricopeptide repeat protein [Desulfamplus sp.]
MKSDSDAVSHSDFTPDHYFSDFLIGKVCFPIEKKKREQPLFEDKSLDIDNFDNQWLTQFNSFVKDMLQISDISSFTCAVIRFKCAKSDNCHNNTICNDKNQMETLVHALNSAIMDKDGVWQWLSESTLIIALWGDKFQAEETIKDFIIFTETTLKIKSHAGAAVFPFFDFSPEMTLCNAVKALDHSAFFVPGTLTFFDDVTQNIYGDRLYQLGRVEDAAREYEKGLEIRGDNLNLLNSLGVCYSLMNRLDLAREQFDKAIQFYKSSQPEKISKFKSTDDTNEISTTPISKNDDGETDDSQFMIFYNAALTCNLVGDIEKGIEYINQATKMHKDFFEAELTAGILFLKANTKDDALVHLNKAVKLKPESAVAHRILGDLYLQTNLPAKSVHEYTLALKLNPCDSSSMSGLARALEIQNKNLDIALTLALNSLAITPDNPYFRTRLAKIYLKKGRYDFADIEFSEAYMQFKEAQNYSKKEESKETDSLMFDSSEFEFKQAIVKQGSIEIDRLFEYEDSKEDDFKKRSA